MEEVFRPYAESDDPRMEKLLEVVCGCKSPADLQQLLGMWPVVSSCKGVPPEGDVSHLAHQAEKMFQWLDRGWLYRDAIATNTLREYGVWCLAIGFLQGMRTGRELDTKTGGAVALLLKHASVRRLLLKEPKATNVAICKALDKVEGLPWPKLRKQYGTWEAAAGHQNVRTLISQARRAAQAQANNEHFQSVLKTVPDATGLVKAR